jgi:hypothetical protein
LHADGSAVALPESQVLAIGGIDANGAGVLRAELFDATAETWTTLPDMPSARAWAGSVILTDGSVLFVGGSSSPGDLYGIEGWGTSTPLADAFRFVFTPTAGTR